MQRKLLTSAIMGASLLFAGQTFAAGYYVDEQSAIRLGDAFSGGAASASDASAAYYGPASMILVRDEVAINASAVSVSSRFSGDAKTLGGADINGTAAKNSSTDVLPSLYFVKHLDPDLAIGGFINAPYATASEFGKQSVARYQAADSEITGIDIGASFALRVHEKVTIGGSLIAQYLKAKTGVAVDAQAACMGAEANGDVPTSGCTAMFGFNTSELGSNTYDGYFEMEGHNTVMGIQLGVLVELTDNSRIGFNYRTEMKHSLAGDATVDFSNNPNSQGFATAAGLIPANGTAKGRVEMTTPESASISYFHQLNDLSLQADFTYTDWTSFNTLDIESNDPAIQALTSEPKVHNWRESYRIAVGANYKLDEKITVRGGMAFDTTPIKSQYVQPDFPFGNYKAISLGATYSISQDTAIDMGIQHTLKQERDMDSTASGTVLDGKMTTEVTSFALGLRVAI